MFASIENASLFAGLSLQYSRTMNGRVWGNRVGEMNASQ